MSGRPGYEELVARRGREVADAIIASAEVYSDNANQAWDVALRWAIAHYDRSEDPELTAQQEENARLADDLTQRRGAAARPIHYLTMALGGDAYDHPARLARAEAIYDAHGWRLPPDTTMQDELNWARNEARAIRRRDPEATEG